MHRKVFPLCGDRSLPIGGPLHHLQHCAVLPRGGREVCPGQAHYGWSHVHGWSGRRGCVGKFRIPSSNLNRGAYKWGYSNLFWKRCVEAQETFRWSTRCFELLSGEILLLLFIFTSDMSEKLNSCSATSTSSLASLSSCVLPQVLLPALYIHLTGTKGCCGNRCGVSFHCRTTISKAMHHLVLFVLCFFLVNVAPQNTRRMRYKLSLAMHCSKWHFFFFLFFPHSTYNLSDI